MDRAGNEVVRFARQRPELTHQVLIGGPPELLTYLFERLPDARHITELYHVVEHLTKALQPVVVDETRRAGERARWCHELGVQYMRLCTKQAHMRVQK